MLLKSALIILVAMSAALFSSGVAPVHAISGMPLLSILPSTQSSASPGSYVRYNVTVSNISLDLPMVGWALYVWADNLVLNPVNITLGSFLTGTTESTECINALCPFGGAGPDDGPGVVHSEAYTAGNGNSGNGTLFTITYRAVSALSTPIVSFSDELLDTLGEAIPHATIQGSYGPVGTPDFSVVVTPPWIFGEGVYWETVGVTGSNGFTGTVTLSAAATPGLFAIIFPTTLTIGPPGFADAANLLVLQPSIPGHYTLNVTASSGSLSHTITADPLTVKGFTITPDQVVIKPAHKSFRATLTLTSFDFAGNVTMKATVSPDAGLDARVAPTSVSLVPDGSRTAVLNMRLDKDTVPNKYFVTVTGTCGLTIYTTRIEVLVGQTFDG